MPVLLLALGSRYCRAWEIALGWTAIDPASFLIAVRRNSVTTTSRISSRSATKHEMIAKAIATTCAKIGKIAMTTSTITTTIGITAAGMATPEIGGITCGMIIPL